MSAPPRPPPFFAAAPAPTEIYTLSLHDALPISAMMPGCALRASGYRDPTRSSPGGRGRGRHWWAARSEEHTSELQSRGHLVCRLLLEKKKSRQQARESPPDRASAQHDASHTRAE